MLLLFSEIRSAVCDVILHTFLFWTLLLYLINRGTGLTRALFIHCDHSLLTYSFYKQPNTIPQLFQIRLWEISKIDVIPALILGFGLDGLILISGDGAWIAYLVILVTLLSMSLFFPSTA